MSATRRDHMLSYDAALLIRVHWHLNAEQNCTTKVIYSTDLLPYHEIKQYKARCKDVPHTPDL